jgi:hypothetical protein
MNHKCGKRRRRRLAAKARLVIDNPAPAQRRFHGGNAGLEIGGYILPPSITGAKQNGVVSSRIRRRDRVYITTDIPTAILWAAQHPTPLLYEVEPHGTIEVDPDHKGADVSFQCMKAKIIAVHEIPPETLQQARSVLLK